MQIVDSAKNKIAAVKNRITEFFGSDKMKQKLDAFNGNDKVLKWYDWVIVIPIMLFCFLSFNHGDILATATHGKDLLECVFKGKFFEFYDYTQSTAVYNILMYAAFMVWSIPVALIYLIIGKPLWGVLEYNAIPYPVLMWYKLLPTLCYFGIAFVLYKIMTHIGVAKSTSKWFSYLFLASPIAMFSQFVFGQYDSIGLLAAVLALYAFVKKKYWTFSILISIAITFKLFALFMFIPLILLVEKRLHRLIAHTGIAMSLYFLTGFMFRGSPGYAYAMQFSGNMIGRFLYTGFGTQFGVTIPLFPILMMAVCVYAYNKKIKDDTEFYANALYIPFFVFAALFMLVLWHPQWVIILMPYAILALITNKNPNSALILLTAMFVGYLGITVCSFVRNVDTNMHQYGIFAEILGENTHIRSLSELAGKFPREIYHALFAGSLAILMYLTAPKKSNIQALDETLTTEKYDIGDRWFVWAIPLSLLLYVVPTMVYFFTT